MLPAAASLSKQGANKGATTAFLISTPESGVDSIAITYALLDPIMTVIRPIAALVTAISAGWLENVLFWKENDRVIEANLSCPVDGCCDGVDCPEEVHKHHHTLYEKIIAGLRYGYGEVWGDIVGWFTIGLILAAIITTFIPESLMTTFLGGGLGSMLMMLVVGMPLYICATASTPVAAAFIMKGVSPGAALVFLLVGPATNITSLSVVTGVLGKKSTILYMSVLAGSAVLFGLGVDYIYQSLGISPIAIIGEASEIVPESIKYLATFVLLILSAKPLFANLKNKVSPKKPVVYFQPGFPVFSKDSGDNEHFHNDDNPSSCDCCGK